MAPGGLEAEKTATGEAWHMCMAQAAADLDDRVSDASMIATGVRVTCGKHLKKMVELFSRTSSLEAIRNMERKAAVSSIEYSTAAVLKQRAIVAGRGR